MSVTPATNVSGDVKTAVGSTLEEALAALQQSEGTGAVVKELVQLALLTLQHSHASVADVFLRMALNYAAKEDGDASACGVKGIIKSLSCTEAPDALACTLQANAELAEQCGHPDSAGVFLEALSEMMDTGLRAWAQARLAKIRLEKGDFKGAELAARMSLQHTADDQLEDRHARICLLQRIVAKLGDSHKMEMVLRKKVTYTEPMDVDLYTAALDELAFWLHETNCIEESAALYLKVLDIWYQVEGEAHKPSYTAMDWFGGCLNRLDRCAEAHKIELYNSCMKRNVGAFRPMEVLVRVPGNEAVIARALARPKKLSAPAAAHGHGHAQRVA